jgi:UDP-N-acetylmuramoyl-L-alanyl-D-glutamate--2,6-diaminopimelate ligase
MNVKLKDLLEAVKPVSVRGSADTVVRGVVCDSRQVRPGYVFVCIEGTRQDGAIYIGDALEKGAVAVVSEKPVAVPRAACQAQVSDARLAMSLLAAAFHGNPSDRMKVVGVTGTNGKTTTSYLVRDILKASGLNPGLVGTVEYQIGQRSIPATRTTPDAALLQSMLAQMVAGGCGSVSMEVSSHSLVQKRTAGIEFDVAIFTNLTRDHLDYHGTIDEYYRAKSLLFDQLCNGRKRGTAVINVDDAYGRQLAASRAWPVPLVTFGIDSQASVRAMNVQLGQGGSRFDVVTPWGRLAVALRLMGRYNVENALGAIATAGALGLDLPSVPAVLAGVAQIPGRLEEISNRRGCQIFVDYAHTDDALEHVLATLRETTPGRLIAVFGCGGNRDRTKRPAMGRVADRLADYTILTSDNPRKEDPMAIIREISAGFSDPTHFRVIEDRRLAIVEALRMAGKGDTVLVAGKGHENFQEFATTTIPFDDRQVVRSELEKL